MDSKGMRESRTGEALLPPDPTVFRITGEDSATYLQSQISAELPAVGDEAGGYTLWLNAKGRIEGDSYLVRTGETETTLVSFHTGAERLRELVERHIIADDVEVEPREGMRAIAFCEGTVPEALLKEEGCIRFKERRGEPALQFFVVPGKQLSELVPEASGGGERGWTRERILRKIPAIPAEAGERDTPMDLELETAVAFNKGCFLGQEVMARVKARGKRRRVLQVLDGDLGAPPPQGTDLGGGSRVLCSVKEETGWLALIQRRAEG